jgi:hypothetical protein
MKSETKIPAHEIYAFVFGLFLGLTILKFGNPIILDHKISAPNSLSEAWSEAWPARWSNWILWPLIFVGAGLALTKKLAWPGSRWVWLLPLAWFGWQLISASQTVDADLTAMTLWQFAGCVACYFLGVYVLGSERGLRWLLVGMLAAFAFCLVCAVDQRLFEFPQSHQMLVEGERTGWTNMPPEMFLELKHDNIIINTNGLEIANPVILNKFGKDFPLNANWIHRAIHALLASTPRVNGTLIYPNALAGLILLLFPVALVLAFDGTRRMKRPIRWAGIALVIFLGGAGFFWTGSKLSWLIAMVLAGVCLFRLKWSFRWKWLALVLMLMAGLGILGLRYHGYFTSGAKSVGARLDYWHAAGQMTLNHPLMGTGAGTFQRSYARLKAPESEMARLAHNDYLEQFSDSGIPAGIVYTLWIFLLMATLGRRLWHSKNSMAFAIFLGLFGWFIQGMGEFGLYIPALAWIAFSLAGVGLRLSGNQIDKTKTAN